MTKSVKIGVIGTSGWAEQMYLPHLAGYDRAALLAICGRNQDRAQVVAAKYNIPQVYADYQNMIANAGLEAIVVSTPDDTHYALVMAALDAGLHVICEKPVALNADDAQAMAEKAESAGVKHMVFHTFRWVPSFRYLKQRVDEGYVGPVHHALLRYIAGYGRADRYLWRFDGDRANGILGDLGSHMIDLARWYIGDVASVSASIMNFYDRQHEDGTPVTTANDLAALDLTFANGAQASIQVSAAAHLADREMHQETALYGADGTLETSFYLAKPHYEVRGARKDDSHFSKLAMPEALLRGISPENPFGNFLEQSVGARYFIDCILDDKMPEPNLHDGYKIQQVIDAALESSRTGQRVVIG